MITILAMNVFGNGLRDAPAVNSRLMRSGLLEVLSQDCIRADRAKGLRNRTVIIKHGLKNALISVVTYMGVQFGQLLGGAVAVETVFACRGLGTLTLNAIFRRDLPLAQGTVLFIAVAYLLVNLGADLLYACLDPRIRYD